MKNAGGDRREVGEHAERVVGRHEGAKVAKWESTRGVRGKVARWEPESRASGT